MALPLVLIPDEGLEGIYDVMWNVFDEDDNMVTDIVLNSGEELIESEGDDWVQNIYGNDGASIDRLASFTPIEAGIYRIEVAGFYKQTNPQFIASLELTVE